MSSTVDSRRKRSEKSKKSETLNALCSARDREIINNDMKSEGIEYKDMKKEFKEFKDNMKECNSIEELQHGLDVENEKRRLLEAKYTELQKEYDHFVALADEARRNPVSKYDELIKKQVYFNDTLSQQLIESKEKLKLMSQSLKQMQACGRDCDIHVRDLLIDYNCITKADLSKEIKRFQRMQIDLKSNLDRLHWRLDCESKLTHSLSDQYHKLHMDLYFLKNLNNQKSRDVWIS